MISHARTTIRNRWELWAKKRNSPGNPQIVDTRNLYILPSAFGWAYGVVVFALLIGAVNYQINTIFLMTFLLAIIGMVSACEAHGNILNLSFKFIVVEDAEQGKPARVTLFVHGNNKIRFGIGLRVGSQPDSRLEKIPEEGMQFVIPVETQTRGYFQLPPIIITSLYPFAIFKVWSYIYFDEYYYVYPKPVDPNYWPPANLDQNGEKKSTAGDEEFYDLKQVEDPWGEPKLIAWKIAARGQGWYLKRMKANQVDYWVFNLNELPQEPLEVKLQHICYWLITAEANGLMYGVDLTGLPTMIGQGKEHLQHCLRQLALYQ